MKVSFEVFNYKTNHCQVKMTKIMHELTYLLKNKRYVKTSNSKKKLRLPTNNPFNKG